MNIVLAGGILAAVLLLGAVVYMLVQRPVTDAQRLIQLGKFPEAVAEAEQMSRRRPSDAGAWMHLGDAQKLSGRFEDAVTSYRHALRIDSRDAAPREGIALATTYAAGDLQTARALMEEAVSGYPQIQEFQALALAFILLRQGQKADALRLYEDNLVLLQTRFQDDYTDRDPLLAETLFHFATLAEAAGDAPKAEELHRKVVEWGSGSVFAQWSASASSRDSAATVPL